VTAPRTATGGARHAVAAAVAAAVALGATELVAGALPAAPSLVQSVASVVIDLAPIGVVRAAIDTLGTRDKPVLVAGVVLLSLLFGAGLALAARRRRWVAVLGLVAFGVLGAWAGARPPGTAAWRPALAALAGVLAGVATLAALAWRSAGPAAEVTTLPGAPASTPGPAWKAAGGGAPSSDASGVPSALEVASRRSFLVGAGSLLAAGAAAAAGGRLLQSREQVSARRGVALPRLGETAGPAPGAMDLDVPGLSPFITPTRDFYRVDTAIFPPGVDPRGWRLEIGGMVERPFQLSYEQLLAMPMEEHDVTLVCVSNEVGDRLSGNAR
jgi:Oxidoreductase molybdopterin binding domain